MTVVKDKTEQTLSGSGEAEAELEQQRAERSKRRRTIVIASLSILAAAAAGLIVADLAGNDNGGVTAMHRNVNGGNGGAANMPNNMAQGRNMPQNMMGGGSQGATGAAPAPGNAHQINTTLGEFWVRPSATSVAAGKVTFTAQNVGKVPHELMVERMPIAMEGPGLPVEDAAQGMIEDLDPGQSGKMTLDLKTGMYMLFCNVTGHYAAGQHTVLRVTG